MKQEDTSSEAGPPMELDVQRLLQTPQFSRSLLASLIAFPGLQQHSESPGSLLAMPQVEPSPTTGIHSMNPPLFHRAAQGAQPQQPPPAPPPQPAATEGGRRQQQPAPTTVQLRDSDKPQVSQKQPTGKQSVANSDGWQWRKYGEKVVKGSPNPRSYYKCSHASCPAKKIVERNEAGDVLSTDYKGEHCHPAPNSAKASRFKPPKPRGAAPAQEAQASSSTAGMAAVAATTQATLDPRLNLLSVPGLGQLGLLGFPAMSMLSLPDALRGLHSPYEEPPQHDDDDDTDDTNEQTGATQPKSAGKDEVSKRTRDGSHSARKEFRKDEGSPVNSKRLDALAEAAEKELFSNSPESVPSSKRQRTEAPNSTAKSTRAADDDAEGDDDDDMREGGRQRVIHVDSETYADGYKWRKYGQKQVKGSPYPRSYYKCTHPNCPVRKHVERSADHSDKWTVTYEGQHSHPAPNQTARKSPKSPEGAAEPEPQKQQQQAAEAIKDDSSQPSSPQRPTSFSRAQSRGVPAMPALTTQYQTLLQAQQLAFMHASLAQASLAHIPLLPGFTAEGLAQAAGARSLAEGSQATPDAAAAAAVASPLANLAAANLSLFASQLMRQLTPLDFAVLGAASAQASGSASGSAGWDPLACLITPRSTASPSVPPPSSRGGQKRSRQDDAVAAARGGSEQATTASGAAAGGKQQQRQQGLRWLKSTVEPMEEEDDGDGEEGNEDGEAAASGEEEENEGAAAAGEEEEDVKPAVMKASVKVKDEPLQAHGGEPQQKVGGRRANSKYAKVKEEQQVRAAGAVEEAAGEQGGSSEKPPAERGTRAAGGGTKVTVKAELQ